MTAKLISGIRVKNLFGFYSYTLPKTGAFLDAAILYGDNGVGKSTLLRLVFHLLSAANNRGHRTLLSNAHFDSLEVDLSSGVTLSAEFKNQKKVKSLLLKITKGDSVLAVWDYMPGSSANSLGESVYLEETLDGRRIVRRYSTPQKRREFESVPQGEAAYLTALKEHVPNIFILNAERRLDSDSIPDPSDEVELRRVMHYEEPKRIHDLVVRSREIALSQALGSASKWLSRKAVVGANRGSMNVHSVYLDVLQHILSPAPGPVQSDASALLANMQQRLSQIEVKTTAHSKYELATELSTAQFRKALAVRSKPKKALVAQLLQPYITSLESRLEAVDPIYQLTDKFVNTINGFLNDKTLDFSLSQGFEIIGRLKQTLGAPQLSSGEQQLLLLFSYVLVARDQPSVFMIDEPELSLNVKWQRKLVQSLLEITEDSSIQFIFASHSIELLAQHRNRVIKLENTK